MYGWEMPARLAIAVVLAAGEACAADSAVAGARTCSRRSSADRRAIRPSLEIGLSGDQELRLATALPDPEPDEPAEVSDEALVLVLGVQRADRVDEQGVELLRGDPVEDKLVDVGEAAGAEVAVAVGVEVLVGQPAVGGELLLVRQVVAVADLEVAARVEVEAGRAAGHDAEHRPLHQGAHRPREVVVQARERDVRAGVGVVDRVDVAAAHERLAGVELPAEERVDEPPYRDDLLADLR